MNNPSNNEHVTNLPFKASPLCRASIPFALSTVLFGCGGGGSGGSESNTEPPPIDPPVAQPSNEVTTVPFNQITHAYFRDENGTSNAVSGSLVIEAKSIDDEDPSRTESVSIYWADEQGNKLGERWLDTPVTSAYTVTIPENTTLPENTNGLLIFPTNAVGESSQGQLVKFHDYVSNANLSGPGGSALQAWTYGEDRPTINIQRSDRQGGMCKLDNGLISVIDMNNLEDTLWNLSTKDEANVVNDTDFPIYEFLCDEQPVNTERAVWEHDHSAIRNYSTLNDAMFYGTVVYDTFLKYLGEPPLEDKLRLRVHYGSTSSLAAYWDGAYANFSDAVPFYYSFATLDVIAHEVAHGVLSRISDLNSFDHEISVDAHTIHEAFSDISGVMASYEFSGEMQWAHREESGGDVRSLDKIKTVSYAIDSALDYDDAGDNYYLRMGMITYPFYLLTANWGIESAYRVYIDSARNCWSAMTTLTEAAECIKEQAVIAGHPEQDVIDAFKTVKIKLFEEGVLSHFNYNAYKLRTQFTDNSQSTNQVSQWNWDFGDGETSNEPSPEHTYSEIGDYEVTLTVTDQSGDQDNFTRSISVTDQYCAISSNFTLKDTITDVSVGGTDLNFNQAQSDYTQSPINITDANNVVINVQGDNPATELKTTWAIWIDLNDDGIYGDSDGEKVFETDTALGQPYGLTTTLNLSDIPNDGTPKHMRIVGDGSIISACYHAVGEALDLRVNW